MTTLETLYRDDYCTLYIVGPAPMGLGCDQYKALGDLAGDVRTELARRGVKVPGERVPPPSAGWSITTPTPDMGRIRSVAQDIVSGNLESLPAKFRQETTQ